MSAVALLAWWKGPLLFLLAGLMVFVYIHDGPPYFEVSDLISNELHHEKILVLLGVVFVGVLAWPPRDRVEWILYVVLAAMFFAIAARVLSLV